MTKSQARFMNVDFVVCGEMGDDVRPVVGTSSSPPHHVMKIWCDASLRVTDPITIFGSARLTVTFS